MANYADLTDTELSARVAEKVMGCSVYKETLYFRCDCGGANSAGPRPHGEILTAQLKPYATDGSAMLQVLERMREREYSYRIEDGYAEFWQEGTKPYGKYHSFAQPLPRAVAEAALAAVEGA